MKKFIDSVKALGEKMTGKEIEGTKLIDVIDETAENYQGGTGSGSEIVDALPAQGKEGNTYLLRKKDESKVFKAQCYAQLYAKSGYTNFDLVMIDADIALLMKEIKTKLNPDLSNGLVDFSQLNSFEQASKSSEEWNTLITSNKVAIVKTEEEVSKITEAVDYIFQDLGEIGVENFTFLELISKDISSGTIYRLAGLLQFLNSYSSSVFVEKLDEMAIFKTRKVVYNSEATSSQPKYSFAEWQDVIRGSLKATLTDAYMYDQETLMSLEDGDCYLINLTPITPEYSYTQYVFDQGVYTIVGGENSGAGNIVNLCDYYYDTAAGNSLRMFDSNSNYHFDVDAFIKYIEESGVGDIPLEPNMQGTESNGITVLEYEDSNLPLIVSISSKSTSHNSSFYMRFIENNVSVDDLINESGDTLLKFLTRNKSAIKEKFDNVSFSGSSIRSKLSNNNIYSSMCVCEAWKFASTNGVYTHSMNLTKFLALFKA